MDWNKQIQTDKIIKLQFARIRENQQKKVKESMPTKISVAVRVRPQLESERVKNLECSKLSVVPNSNSLKIQVDEKNFKIFKFDQILHQSISQYDVFEKNSIDQFITKVIKGYHCTILAYGQTGSGKTYSMEGFDYEHIIPTDPYKKQKLKPKINLNIENEQLGIIPRVIKTIFEQIERENLKGDRIYKVYVSYLQIYNEKIYDLLNMDLLKKKTGQGLRLRWNRKDQFQVENLFIFECSSSQEAFNMLSKGIKNKMMASHKLNTQSSRSHTIFTMKVESMSRNGNERVISAKLHLVDLAGSERQSLTGTEGQHLKECIEINKSLFTLRQVITALSEQISDESKDNSNGQNSNQSKFHVPYRDSKLTSLLKQSIGGSSYCLMIACLSPCDIFQEENISTLNYATKARQISNDPIRNEDPKDALIEQLKKQLDEFRINMARANDQISLLGQLSGDHINEFLTNSHKPTIENIQKDLLDNQEKNNNNQVAQQQTIPIEQIEDDHIKGRNEEQKDKILLKDDLNPNLHIQYDNPDIQQQAHNEGGQMSSEMIVKKLLESTNMVRDLLNQNIQMSQKMDNICAKNQFFEEELSIIQNENRNLRDTIDQMHQYKISEQNKQNEKIQQLEQQLIQDKNQQIQQIEQQIQQHNKSYNNQIQDVSSLKKKNDIINHNQMMLEQEQIKDQVCEIKQVTTENKIQISRAKSLQQVIPKIQQSVSSQNPKMLIRQRIYTQQSKKRDCQQSSFMQNKNILISDHKRLKHLKNAEYNTPFQVLDTLPLSQTIHNSSFLNMRASGIQQSITPNQKHINIMQINPSHLSCETIVQTYRKSQLNQNALSADQTDIHEKETNCSQYDSSTQYPCKIKTSEFLLGNLHTQPISQQEIYPFSAEKFNISQTDFGQVSKLDLLMNNNQSNLNHISNRFPKNRSRYTPKLEGLPKRLATNTFNDEFDQLSQLSTKQQKQQKEESFISSLNIELPLIQAQNIVQNLDMIRSQQNMIQSIENNPNTKNDILYQNSAIMGQDPRNLVHEDNYLSQNISQNARSYYVNASIKLDKSPTELNPLLLYTNVAFPDSVSHQKKQKANQKKKISSAHHHLILPRKL